MPRVTTLEWRAVCGWLGLSSALHVAFVGAWLAVPGASPREADPAAGSGVVLVELVGVQGAAGAAPGVEASSSRTTASDSLPSPPASTQERRRVASRPPVRAGAVARESGASAPRALEPALAPLPAPAATAQATAERAATTVAAGGGAVAAGEVGGGEAATTGGDPRAGGALSRVARPASEIRPLYPERARERGDEGEVVVEAWIAATGKVEQARVSRSAGPDLDRAAVEAVRRAPFHPAWRDGAPVRSVVALRMHFELER